MMGKIGVGKNYIAEKILLPALSKSNPKPTLILGLADHFKITAVSFNNMEYDKVFHQKDSSSRLKLQAIGTEMGRDKYGDDIWINVLYNWIKLHNERGIERFIIIDCRFKNETEFFKKINAYIIKIIAPDRNYQKLIQESNGDLNVLTNLSTHSSEIYIDQFTEYDLLINNQINQSDNISNDINNFILNVFIKSPN